MKFAGGCRRRFVNGADGQLEIRAYDFYCCSFDGVGVDLDTIVFYGVLDKYGSSAAAVGASVSSVGG
ncbi:hypothetical protein TNCV_3956621 [Trichonephila clavipes]|nr:hypothetical protein TNCV_3956621 [Trichonephila clavipes]